MDTQDQQVNTMNQSNNLNSNNQSESVVLQHPKNSNQHNSYNANNKGVSQYNPSPLSHQSKPVKKKGFYNRYNPSYQNGHHYGNNTNSYYHQHKFNQNHMSTKSQGKQMNYHRAYHNQSHHQSSNTNSNHNNEKYDSVANSVSPPSISNSSNNTASPSNLASPNSLSNQSSSTDAINTTNVSTSNNNGNQTNTVAANSNINSIENANATTKPPQPIIDQSSKVETASNQSTIDTASNLVNDMNNLQINANHAGSSKFQRSQPTATSVIEKSAPLVNQTTSFKTTNGGQHTQQQPSTYSNHHNKPHSPEALVGSNMMMNSNNNNIPAAAAKISVPTCNHYSINSGSRHNQSNKMHYSNNSSYPMNNSLNTNTGGYPFQSKINNYPRGGKKPQHLLNNATTSKSPQIMNQSNMPNNGNSYAKMNPGGMTHLVNSVNSKMTANPTIPQNHSIIPTHPQMIGPNGGYPLFYNSNFINQHSQNQIAMSNAMHNQNVHLPQNCVQNCVQCQYSMNGQYMTASPYPPAQFVHFPPYQYNPNQMTAIHPHPGQSMNANHLNPQQQQQHRLQYTDSQMNRANQQTNINQSTSNAQHQQNVNANNTAANKYAQQQDHMTAPTTHLPPAQFAYNPYMSVHAIPNYYYSAGASNYNESQLNPHLIPNSSNAMMVQQQHQLQVSIMNNLQHHQTQANHSTLMMGQQPPNDQFGGGSNLESIPNNTADNSRSNSTANYDANGSNYNSLLLQTAPQTVSHPPNAISPLSPFDNKFYSTNYANTPGLSEQYNPMIWPQQQNHTAATPNLLIGNTGSNTNHFTNEDMLSSHNNLNKTPTNANNTFSSNTDNSANSNIVNQIAESTGLLDKK